MPSRTCAPRPATRTMKNSSRLLAEIARNLSRSSSGLRRLADSSSTRRLKFNQDNSRLMKRSGLAKSVRAGLTRRLVGQALLGAPQRSGFSRNSSCLAAVGHGFLMLLEGDVGHLCNNPMKITYPHNAVPSPWSSSRLAKSLRRLRRQDDEIGAMKVSVASRLVAKHFRGQCAARCAALPQRLLVERDDRGSRRGKASVRCGSGDSGQRCHRARAGDRRRP